MSRSLNAKIISLVISSVSEFNLTVTKTPDTLEEYPTNWPTYWFVFHSSENKNKQTKITWRFRCKIIHFYYHFGPLPLWTLLIWHLTSGTGLYLKPILPPFHQKMANLKFETNTSLRHFWPFRQYFHENRMIFHKLPAAKTKPFVYRPKDNKIRLILS